MFCGSYIYHMKKFFKKVVYVLGILMVILIIAAVAGIIYLSKNFGGQPTMHENSILELNFDNNLAEKSQPQNIIMKLVGEDPAVSFRETLDILHEACADNRIKAISIKGTSLLDHTKVMSIREALKEFRTSCDKKIYAYGDYYSQSGYLLATQADSLFLHPMGSINLVGYSAVLSYYKDLLDRWDIDLEIYKAGKYKSYTESFTANSASSENKEQYMELLTSMHEELLSTLAENSAEDTTFWSEIIQENLGSRAEKCLELKLVDKIMYEANYKDRVLAQYDEDKGGFVSLADYKNALQASAKKANVALVVMEGAIDVGGDQISSNELKKELKKIRESDDYKAVVLRINSGGGSAFASDDIWNEIELIKAKGIPVVASIGSVAASGGYYVLMNSDKIFAQANSIVGSIGVFIMIPQVNEALEKHVGVHFTEFKTSNYTNNLTLVTNMSDEMKVKLQQETDFIYDTFITKVSSGRGLEKDSVYEYAQGRIYPGHRSKELGLIDDIKSLTEVLEYVKSTYELEYIAIKEFPEPSNELLPSNINMMANSFASSKFLPLFSKKAIQDANSIIHNSFALEPRMEWYGISIE